MPAMNRWTDGYLIEKAGGWYGNARFKEANMTLADFIASKGGNNKLPYLPRLLIPHELRRDLSLPAFLECPGLMRYINGMHMRFTDDSYIKNGAHFDAGDFMSIQIDGFKRWSLVDPADALFMYVDHIYHDEPVYGHCVFAESGVDVRRLPRIRNVTVHEGLVAPGDILFLPNRWWHEVDTLSGRNMALLLQTELPPPDRMRANSSSRFSYSLISHTLEYRADARAARGVDSSLGGVPKTLASCFDAAAEAPPASSWDDLFQAALNKSDANWVSELNELSVFTRGKAWPELRG